MKIVKMASMVLLAVAIMPAAHAAKNTTRHCDGQIHMEANLDSVGAPFRAVYLDDSFKARGSCGRSVPNSCRARARDKLIRCFRAATEQPDTLPAECRPESDVFSYNIGALSNAAKNHLCGFPDLRNRSFQVDFTLETGGNNRCPGSFQAFNPIEIVTTNCP